MGFDGCCMAGSSGETSVCVSTLTTGTSSAAAASSFCSDWASRYPISPWLAAPQTSSVCPYTTSEARSERSNCAPTCGPLPWVMTRRYPRRTRPTIASAVRRVFANCSAMVPFSPARMSELPPTATSAVFDIGSLILVWQRGGGEKEDKGNTASYPPNQTRGLLHEFQHRFTEAFAFRCTGAHQFQHNRLLRMQPVLCLKKDKRPRRIDHLIGNFLTAMCR